MKTPSRDHRQLQQIIAGLTDGVILIGTDQRILWANDAALAMHGIRRIKDLGATVGEYRRRFRLRYRNNRPVERGKYPIERVVAGENFQRCDRGSDARRRSRTMLGSFGSQPCHH